MKNDNQNIKIKAPILEESNNFKEKDSGRNNLTKNSNKDRWNDNIGLKKISLMFPYIVNTCEITETHLNSECPCTPVEKQ
jgi:hypothetical protein